MFREDLSRDFGFIMNDVARLMRTAFDRRVRALGLTRSQWWVLNHLFRNDGITQSELADVLEVQKPTLGRLLASAPGRLWHRLLGGQCLSMAAYVRGLGATRGRPRRPRGLMLSMVQGLGVAIAALALYGFAIRVLSATIGSLIMPIVPVFAALLAIPVLGEIPTLVQLAGMAGVCAGMVIVSRT